MVLWFLQSPNLRLMASYRRAVWDVSIECLGLIVYLSPEMHLRISVLYNPPTNDNGFYQKIRLPNSDKLVIPKQDLLTFEQERSGVTWNEVLQSADPNTCCSELMNAIDKIIKYLKRPKKSNGKNSLPSVESSIQQLMKERVLALKACLKSHTNTGLALYKNYVRLKQHIMLR